MSNIKRNVWKKLNAHSPPILWAHPGHLEAVPSRCAVAANTIFMNFT